MFQIFKLFLWDEDDSHGAMQIIEQEVDLGLRYKMTETEY